jgi:polar amino acid transport system substrate-binding protein
MQSKGNHRFLSALALLACLAGLVGQTFAQATTPDTITLPWTERQPFQYIDNDGKLKGILYNLGEQIFTKAGIRSQWAETPANRIIRELEENTERQCLVGWFKTPEREKIAKITLPIYQDKPLRGIIRADNKSVRIKTASALFADASIKVLIKQGYSYGVQLDELIASRNGQNIERSVGDHTRLVRMLREQRTDLLFLTQEEIDHYTATAPDFAKDFKVINFTDLPSGNFRHILCSKRVPDATIEKLNQAIKATIKLN